ncbi:hypothetical protein DL98DRAFT_537630 [Cadophora sp. DSE1049]|nr:hypothetical protein DL98DRAFT_537630 [Cadophora sp. DSE1049]
MPFKVCPCLAKLFRCKGSTHPTPIPAPASSPPQYPSQHPPPPSMPQNALPEVPSDPPPAYTLLPLSPNADPIETLEELQTRRARQRREELASERYIRQNTKTCPKCHWAVEKTEGCHHMVCRCNHSFCWLCLAKWEQSIYQDFHHPTCALYPRDRAQQVFQFTGRLFPDFSTPASTIYQTQNQSQTRIRTGNVTLGEGQSQMTARDREWAVVVERERRAEREMEREDLGDEWRGELEE